MRVLCKNEVYFQGRSLGPLTWGGENQLGVRSPQVFPLQTSPFLWARLRASALRTRIFILTNAFGVDTVRGDRTFVFFGRSAQMVFQPDLPSAAHKTDFLFFCIIISENMPLPSALRTRIFILTNAFGGSYGTSTGLSDRSAPMRFFSPQRYALATVVCLPLHPKLTSCFFA